MAFNVQFQDKYGNEITFNQVDDEVCELWGVPSSEEVWASPPDGKRNENWQQFLGRAVFVTRGFKETGIFNPSELFQGLCLCGCMFAKLETIQDNRYYIQLLFDWIRKEYRLVVTNI